MRTNPKPDALSNIDTVRSWTRCGPENLSAACFGAGSTERHEVGGIGSAVVRRPVNAWTSGQVLGVDGDLANLRVAGS